MLLAFLELEREEPPLKLLERVFCLVEAEQVQNQLAENDVFAWQPQLVEESFKFCENHSPNTVGAEAELNGKLLGKVNLNKLA